MSGDIQYARRIVVHTLPSCDTVLLEFPEFVGALKEVPRADVGRILQDILDRGLAADSPHRRIGEQDTIPSPLCPS
jgi:hypothetical protein